MTTRINPTFDEGLSGDIKALHLATLRAGIRKLIEGPGGYADWSRANKIGKTQIPTMAAVTIINFAYGKTRTPSTWTIRILAEVLGYETIFVLRGTVVPNAIKLE